MADQIKYVDSTRLQYLLGKLRDKNAELFLGKYSEAASAAKVKSTLTINGEAFDGSAAKVFSLSETGHKHVAADITDFTGAVQKVISEAGGTSHTHSNLATLEKIGEDSLTTWNNKIGANDVDKLKYSNVGMSGVADVKGALDILVKNAQINTAALTDTSANMNSLATKLTTAEGNISTAQEDIAALKTAVGDAESGLTKKVADLEAANAEGGAVANAIADAKKAGTDAQTTANEAKAAVAAEKTRAEDKEAELQGAIDTINNASTGILAQAKAYADQQDNALDGKITKAQSAADKAQGEVDALEGVVGNKTDAAGVDTVFGKIATAQAQANKGVADAATAKAAADAAQDDVDALANKVGEVETGKTVVQMIAEAKAEATYDDTVLAGRVSANESAIGVLNGDSTTEGSVKKAIADVIGAAPENMNTLKELADAITAHQGVYEAYVATVTSDIAKAKQEAINQAKTDAAALDATLKTDLEAKINAKADQTALQEEITRATGIESGLRTDINTLNAGSTTVGSVDYKIAQAKATIDGNIQGLDTRLTTAEGDIDDLEATVAKLDGTVDVDGSVKKQIKDAVDPVAERVTTAEGKITALETTVGDKDSGLVKDVADLKTTVGSDASGLVKDVADLKAKDSDLDGEISALKAKDTALVNEDTRLAGLINTNAGNIATNTGNITDLKGTVSGHTTSINNLNQFMNSHGTITEEEIDAILNTVYGAQA